MKRTVGAAAVPGWAVGRMRRPAGPRMMETGAGGRAMAKGGPTVRVRLSWLVAVSAVLLAGGCGSDPVRPAPVPPSPLPAIGADGRPITNLCQLLSGSDITAVGVTATSSPDTTGSPD